MRHGRRSWSCCSTSSPVPPRSMDDRGHVDAVRYPAFAELERDRDVVSQRVRPCHDLHRARPVPAILDLQTTRHWTRCPIALRPPRQHLHAARRVAHPDERLGGGHCCVPARTVRGRSHRRPLWRPHGDRWPADLALVWLHMVAPTGIPEPPAAVGIGDVGQLRAPSCLATSPRTASGASTTGSRQIAPGARPQLSLKHTLSPAALRRGSSCPTGRLYRRPPDEPIPGLSQLSFRDPDQVASLYQRHLLQLGFADHELGGAPPSPGAREGLLDESLIVVTADHGVAFDVGRADRRRITRDNAAQIAPVPLFVKAPGAAGGRDRQRLRRDRRHPSHDRRCAGHAAAGPDGRDVRVRPGGPPASAHDPHPRTRLAQAAALRRRRVGASQGRGARAEAAPLRRRKGWAAPPVPHRPEP